jgi:methylenetetrahydrofolate dehydrogenase (NADP+)/methenyltetrahydrofolate cyclohydrolase
MVAVGEAESIRDYVRVVTGRAREVGISVVPHLLSEDATREELGVLLSALNADGAIHGVSLQLPLPAHMNVEEVATALEPDKDVEGFHPANAREISRGTPRLVPPPAQGAPDIMDAFGIEPRGKQAVVVGRSALIGRPLATLLMQAGASVAVAHRGTPNLPKLASFADLLVVGASLPGVLPAQSLKPGAIVLDYGIIYGRDGDGNPSVTGNFDFEIARGVAGAITPMPGGTGPMTTLSHLRNTLKAAQMQAATSTP